MSEKCQQPTSLRNFIPSLPELTIRWGVAPQGKDRCSKCPDEPNIIVAITSTETCKREVGVSKCIPTHLISQFFDEPFFA